jgi:hypothetical protein
MKKDEVYVVCSTCGISNPETAHRCSGCGESLEGNHSFIVEKENDEVEANELLDMDSAGVVKKEQPKVEKKALPIKKYLLGGLGGLLTIALIVWLVILFMPKSYYLEAADGFYYITETGILHTVDEDGKDLEVGYDVVEPQVYKYGSKTYYLTQGQLYLHDGSSQLIARDVNSFKVNFYGDQILYTISTGQEGLGDLYKYDGEETIRVDGHVGLNRYIFGLRDEVYYVNEITEDENLGILYMKQGNEAPIKIVEDVYAPLFSLRRESVYYSRVDIDTVNRFDLFYVKDQSVTEVSRNVSGLHVNPFDENFILVQYKNDANHLYSIYRNENTEILKNISDTGIMSFGDTNRLQFRENLDLMLKLDEEVRYYNDGDMILLPYFEDYILSPQKTKLYHINQGELLVSTFGPELTDTKSIGRDLSIEMVSDQALIYKGEDTFYTNFTETNNLGGLINHVFISDDDNYIIYKENADAYVQKLGATEPVFLGADSIELINQGQYVFTITDYEIYRYKLGKFSSNQSIGQIRHWGQLELTK